MKLDLWHCLLLQIYCCFPTFDVPFFDTFSLPHTGHFTFTTDIKNLPLLIFISVVFSFHSFKYITKNIIVLY